MSGMSGSVSQCPFGYLKELFPDLKCPLNVSQNSASAAPNKYLEYIQYLHKENKTTDLCNAFRFAMDTSDYDLMELIVKYINQDDDRKNLLQYAITTGKIWLVKWLISAGFKVSYSTIKYAMNSPVSNNLVRSYTLQYSENMLMVLFEHLNLDEVIRENDLKMMRLFVDMKFVKTSQYIELLSSSIREKQVDMIKYFRTLCSSTKISSDM
ncbi:hypothetical protein EBX93_17725, partial [bacterium]|nr:hypothetical protein [bacterium]